MKWRRVRDRRNSECASAKLEDLNWGEWWADNSFGQFYLHFVHNDGESVHRVYCRHAVKPRLGFRDGELWWVI